MLSIIIPTFNEEQKIAQTISKTLAAKGTYEAEIIVVDGGSTDDTVGIAKECGAKVLISDRKGRGAQMNIAASVANGETLYFLHSDSIPPPNFIAHILDAKNKGAVSGSFRLSFDYQHWFLKANCWFTRFNVNAFRFGDQSLFVSKEVFHKIGGFREDLVIMEDQEIIHRIKRLGKFKVMSAAVITSARKYHDNGIYKMQAIFFRIWLLYYLGYPQHYLVKLYKSLIYQDKL